MGDILCYCTLLYCSQSSAPYNERKDNMKTGNSRRDFTGRVIAYGKGKGSRAVNWDNPYIIRKPKRKVKSQSTKTQSTKTQPRIKSPHIPQSESVDYKPDMKYSRYAGSDFGALGER